MGDYPWRTVYGERWIINRVLNRWRINPSRFNVMRRLMNDKHDGQVHVGMSLTRMTNGFQFSKQTYSDNQWFPVHCNGEKDRETPAKT
ncbi:uncharacterized protein YALI1_C14147g [Yarrowia lipolytica]|uniref:Uncharacterized protein n=1 Tax=Yarrowia lipolytica TaxID=4952 RepID=A0A1D8NAF9_YARLL|nr:hypothetical protein YALI1_C14147g [Yarrowia lipolytica]